jgi:dTDP-L-rhamnose 4-epimerase
MSKQILVTGGAGFVGSHLCDELLSQGYRVRVLDVLSAQVHGAAQRPDYLHPEVELVAGDVCDAQAIRQALQGVDAVYHLAAAVGVGQSMYQIARYTEVNNMGTAVLLEALIENPVERLVVASSMSIYGEGLYRDADGLLVAGTERPLSQLKNRDWEVRDSQHRVLDPVATPEWKQPALASVYALSKFDQERLCLLVGRAYGISTVALRFFNIYGTRQALSNPYTGVLAIFASRFLNDQAPLVNEDGHQKRDFVHVRDVARACRLALETEQAAGQVFNVGSGQPRSVLNVARDMAQAVGKTHIEPEITGKYRVGDIRHCYSDISLARDVLGHLPQVSWADGLSELAQWLETQSAEDHVEGAAQELAARGLTV